MQVVKLASRVQLPKWFNLLTGLAFYTAVGVLFFAPNPVLRIAVLLVMLGVWRFAAPSPIILGVAFLLVGIVEYLLGASVSASVVAGLGWSSVVGAMLIALRVYPIVFQGSDWAALAVPFGQVRGADYALACFFVYRTLPDLESRLRRIVWALRAYGHRQRGDSILSTLLLVPDGLIIYFLEAIDILLGNERIAVRRREVLYKAAAGYRRVEVRTGLFGCWLIAVSVGVAFVSGWASQPLVF